MPGELENAQIAIEILTKLRDRLNENLAEAKYPDASKEQIDITLKNYELMLSTHAHLDALINAVENSESFKNLTHDSQERELIDRLKRNAATFIDYLADIRSDPNPIKAGRLFEIQKIRISNSSENYLKSQLKKYKLDEKYPFANEPDNTGEKYSPINTDQINSEFFSNLLEKSIDEINFTDNAKSTWLNEIKRIESYKTLTPKLHQKMEQKEKSNRMMSELRDNINQKIATILEENIPVIKKMNNILAALQDEQLIKSLKDNGFPENFFLKELSQKGNLRQFFMENTSEIYKQLNIEIMAEIEKSLESKTSLAHFNNDLNAMSVKYEIFFNKDYLPYHLARLSNQSTTKLNNIIEKNITKILDDNTSNDDKLGSLSTLIKDIPPDVISEQNQIQLASAVLQLTNAIMLEPIHDYVKLEILQKNIQRTQQYHNIVNNDAIFINAIEEISETILENIATNIEKQPDHITRLNIILNEIIQIKKSKQEEPMTDNEFIAAFPTLADTLIELRDHLTRAVVQDLKNNTDKKDPIDYLRSINRVSTEMPFGVPEAIRDTCTKVRSNFNENVINVELKRIMNSKELTYTEKIKNLEIINNIYGLEQDQNYQELKNNLIKNVVSEINKIATDPTIPITTKISNIDLLASFARGSADAAWKKANTKLISEYANQLTETTRQEYRKTPIEKLVTYADRSELPIAKYCINLEKYVSENIITEPNVNIRTKRMSRWINIAKDCMSKGDFASSMAIFSALHSIPNQLHLTKLNLPLEDKILLTESLQWAQHNNLGWWEKINKASTQNTFLHMSFLGSRIDKCAPNKEKWDGTNIPTIVVAPLEKTLDQIDKTKSLASQKSVSDLQMILANNAHDYQTLEAYKNLHEPADNSKIRDARIAYREEEEEIASDLKRTVKSKKPSTETNKANVKPSQLYSPPYDLQLVLQKFDAKFSENSAKNKLALESILNKFEKNSAQHVPNTIKPLKSLTEEDWSIIREKLPNLGLPKPVPIHHTLTSEQFNKINQIFKFQDKVNENGYKFSLATYDGKNYKNNNGGDLTGTFDDLFVFKNNKLYKRDLATQKQLMDNLPKSNTIADQAKKSLVEINDMINIDLRKILSAPSSQFSQPAHRIDTINTYFYIIDERLNNLIKQLDTVKNQPGAQALATLLQAERDKHQQLQSFITKDLLNPSLVSSLTSTMKSIFKKDDVPNIRSQSDSNTTMQSVLGTNPVILQTIQPATNRTQNEAQRSVQTNNLTVSTLHPPRPGTLAARAVDLKQKGRMEPTDRQDNSDISPRKKM